ncbi:hypothetical protein SAMN05216410_3557 [Sanguibacter gelidistatuariae]|uniref:Large extracellular alpha-helical protein n=1 Tax=Sanguibacter gelidistatuariae TaxID=1814289 RepID=A0A1G6VWR3_9MICO|nr:DUF5719 family protein [Sanguibacter gelidistatuariae]SDD57954.1 hypothetical protein SAMN05216410_3557 [Sanguibacter gelidistatuariae]
MSARRVLSAVTVVAVIAALAGYGTDLFGAGAHADVSGESVALTARGTTLVCPAPVALAGEILGAGADGAGGPGDTDLGASGDEAFGSSPVAPRSTLQVSLFGAQTSSMLEPFGFAAADDAAASGAAADDAAASGAAASGGDGTASGITSVQGGDPSAQLSLTGVESAMIVRSVASAARDADAYSALASVTSAGDLRGLAAAACQDPGITQWLVGGGTELGTTTELVLSNPSRTPATVTLDLWGAGGELVLAGPSTYLVPPGGQVTTLLGGLAAEQNRLVARVSSSGALVTAYLQHTVLDGLTPLGVDYVVAGDSPATAQVLTGVTVEASEVTDADVATLRVLAPEANGTATVRVLGADGQQVLRGASTIDLVAGAVSDVSLAGLPAGTYTVVVQADTDVVAGAEMTRTGKADPKQALIGTPKDRAWVAARHDTSGAGVAAIPAGTRALVVLTALPVSLDGGDDVAADVPIVYASVAGSVDSAGSADSADDSVAADAGAAAGASADPLAADWTPAPRGELRAYGADGALVGRKAISLARGQTVVVDPLTVSGGAAVSSISVVAEGAADGGLTLDWSVLLSAPEVSGSVAIVLPTSPTVTSGSLTVRRSATVGLPLD